MKKLSISFLLLAFIVAFTACNNKAENQDALENEDLDEDSTLRETDARDTAITVNAVDFESFDNAKLTLKSPAEGANLKSGATKFEFNVENYELGTQTEDNAAEGLANSADGQHIHMIVDNDPYTAHYEPAFERELSEGSNVVLAFLSRSFHASVKNKDAYVVRQMNVGNGADAEEIDLTKPHMFYSRPKGEYKGKDTEKILLDFYLINTELSADGNRVRATINGREFMLDEWKPYIIEGLPMGQNTIKLELLDSAKNLIESPYNPVERTITLTGGSNTTNADSANAEPQTDTTEAQ